MTIAELVDALDRLNPALQVVVECAPGDRRPLCAVVDPGVGYYVLLVTESAR